ncbi:MAG TPA: S46 family peptidase [Candidatus Avibacteroides faecavium]|nr:S46 family peptidase [Candidatus Avibacteroides faecavium]
MRQKTLILAALLGGAVQVATADEGMWMLTDIKEQNAAFMHALGLEIGIDDIYNPDSISLKDAVVHFDGGCTGEVISPDGLVLTNHHCGYDYIQMHSSVERDYLTDGFWAMSREEELPCEGLVVTYIDKIMDVTAYVNGRLAEDPDPEGTNYISPAYLEGVAARFAEEQGIEVTPFTRLELKPFYGANRYYLFVKTEYRDVRMVGAPPSAIGKFGADTDNYEWPRHSGDFSLFRIYATADGKPADYSPSNVPLKVKKHLAINIGGIEEGDFTFVMGLPGRNWRYMISDEVEERMQTTNFMRDTIRSIRLKAWGEEMAKSPAIKLQYAGKYASIANYWKNAIGMNKGLIRLDVLETKRQQQERLLAYGKETGNTTYREAYETIKGIVAARHDAMFHSEAILEALMLGTEFASIPSVDNLQKALETKDKTSIDEMAGELKAAADKYFNKNYAPEVDRKVSKLMLEAYASLIPAGQRIGIFALIDKEYKGDIGRFVDDCFETSIFGSREAFDRFMSKPRLATLEDDLMVRYAKSVREGYLKVADDMKEVNKAYAKAHKAWVAGMMELKRHEGTPLYPDANLTLRLTYGKIASYKPADGVTNLCYTTLDGVMEKEDANNPEFIVPERLKELYANKDFGQYAMADGRMPVCFATGIDTTGGNSGSPVFNSKGQLIGCGFDRNVEGLTGDIAYNPALQRAVCVDIRYVLFVIEKYAGAKHLIDEMTIVRQ